MNKPLMETHVLAASIALVCTDRGQHKRIRLTTIEGWWPKDSSGGEPLVYTRNVGRHWGPAEEGLPQEFWCPLCHRNPQVAATRWHELTRGMLNAQLREFDLSYLD